MMCEFVCVCVCECVCVCVCVCRRSFDLHIMNILYFVASGCYVHSSLPLGMVEEGDDTQWDNSSTIHYISDICVTNKK